MKKCTSTVFAMTTAALVLSANASAHNHADESKPMEAVHQHEHLKIEFIEPKSFTDVLPSNEPRGRYRERVLKTFEAYFAEFSDTLPDGQVLDVKVTDIDLAGDTRSARIPIGSALSEVRVMEDIYWPRIKFAYSLKDANGFEIKSDEVDLKDMSYLSRAGQLRGNRQAFKYEYAMLDRWFGDTFEPASKSSS